MVFIGNHRLVWKVRNAPRDLLDWARAWKWCLVDGQGAWRVRTDREMLDAGWAYAELGELTYWRRLHCGECDRDDLLLADTVALARGEKIIFLPWFQPLFGWRPVAHLTKAYARGEEGAALPIFVEACIKPGPGGEPVPCKVKGPR